MTMTASDGGAGGSRRVLVGRLARLAGCAAVSMVFVVALAAAPALADKIDVLTNTSPFLEGTNGGRTFGAIPDYALQAELTSSSDGVHTLKLTNPASNASVASGQGVITGVELDGPGGATVNDNAECCGLGAYLNSNDAFRSPMDGDFFDVLGTTPNQFSGSCDVQDTQDVATCKFAEEGFQGAEGGIFPGQTYTVTYRTVGGVPGLYRLEVHFDFNDLAPGCRPRGYGNEARDRGSSPFGATAASSCKVPATPKIDDVNIDRSKRTAQFHQKAKGATSFTCELLRNRKVLFLHSCGAKKWYSHPLKPGTYVYLVWAGNRAGRSKAAGFMNFKLR
jgi:hypothetical protein